MVMLFREFVMTSLARFAPEDQPTPEATGADG